MSKIVTLIQARTGSKRFPAKILKPVLDQTMLYRMVERVRHSESCSEVVVITTDLPEDRIIEKICEKQGWSCYRGSELDLLDRHYKAAKYFGADIVLKIPSDCPLIDPAIIDKTVQFYLNHSFDYVSNLHPPTYPDGNDVEVFSMDTLEYTWVTAQKDFEREHTTPFIWENRDLFYVGNVFWESGSNFSMTHRFTLDYPEDYQFINAIYNKLYPVQPHFTLCDILELLENEPQLKEINSKYAGVNWYRHHLKDLKTISEVETKIQTELCK
ncbi:MAG: glycosyltransferase family protein [Saprospiraceae bacterium]|nr:glycosyltransferase family protein [Saprospiraceae bacterium]